VLAGVALRAAEGFLFCEHGADHRLLGGGREAQVDEAGAGDFSALHEALGLRMREHRLDDLLGELARIGAQRLGQLHRHVAGDVAMRRDLWAFQRDGGGDEGGFGGALGRQGDLLHGVGEQ
jgi:hypothetical protein